MSKYSGNCSDIKTDVNTTGSNVDAADSVKAEPALHFYAMLQRFLYRDERTGYSRFVVQAKDQEGIPENRKYANTYCIGITPPYFRNAPLEITAEVAGDDRVRIRKIALATPDQASAMALLSGGGFEGVGPKTAEKIVTLSDGHIFSLLENKNADAMLKQAGLSQKRRELFMKRLHYLSEFDQIFQRLTQEGVDYISAEAFFGTYKEETETVLRQHPYRLQAYGVPFFTCEQEAKYRHVHPYDRERLAALVKETERLSEAAGNTCMTQDAFRRYAAAMERSAAVFPVTDTLFLYASLLDKNYLVREEEGQVHIYSRSLYDAEETAAAHIRRLLSNPQPFDITDELIGAIEKQNHIIYAEEQRKAFHLLATSGVKILTGGPGTGKTTTINGLIQAYTYMKPDTVISLCAPTGCAAKKLAESTGRSAKTIHKLLNVKAFGGKIMQDRDEFSSLDADLIIVDESSMIDEELFLMLIRAVKTGATIIFAGDEHQLMSVGPGAVLHDLMECSAIEVCTLTTVFRQAMDSNIIRDSILIRDGKTDLVTGDDVEIIRVMDDEAAEVEAIRQMEKYYKKGRPDSARLFTPARRRKYICGTETLNEAVQAVFRKEGAEDILYYNQSEYAVGDPVLFTRNNYKKSYFNGDNGMVTKIVRTEKTAGLEILADNGTVFLSGQELDDLTPAYAITVHKAQGSECETAIIVLPSQPENMLERSLVYVALTRAKKKAVIITVTNALEKAIRNNRSRSRLTGLKYRLLKAFAEKDEKSDTK